MGVNQMEEPKYFLSIDFSVEPNIDKAILKKKYKEEIRAIIQYYIDRKKDHYYEYEAQQP